MRVARKKNNASSLSLVLTIDEEINEMVYEPVLTLFFYYHNLNAISQHLSPEQP